MPINFFKALLLLISSSVIIVTGYRCAGYYEPTGGPRAPQGQNTGRTSIPLPTPGSQEEEEESNNFYDEDYLDRIKRKRRERRERGALPDDSERCNRKTIRELSRQHGANGILRFDSSSLEDYRMGVVENYSVKCPRIYLSLNEIGSKGIFRGKMSISYQTESAIKIQSFDSGSSDSHNENNRWGGGAWPKTKGERSDRRVEKPFNAIFEDDHSAIILRINEVFTTDVSDGKVSYFGSGEIYFKMFRYSDTAGQGDKCYESGTYMSLFNQRRCSPGYRCSSIRKQGKCWKIAHGPFSCLPDGALRPSGGRSQAAPSIDITGELECFRELATFSNLNLEEAFNVRNINELD